MANPGESIIEAFDYVTERLNGRLEGLGDEEYLWEPVSGCWSLRQHADGRWLLDGDGGGPPPPDPVPFTTIAWRIGHIGGLVLGGFAKAAFGGGEPAPDSWDFPVAAAGVKEFLGSHYAAWRAGMASLDGAGWEAKLGPTFGPYGESTRYDLALHVFDEVVHHAAEVGVVRDLYVQRSELGRS
ncbi:MAG: DinB family protein [Acidimicrobiales bacterium]